MNLISVIIPIYNVRNYLRRCVDSVCNQEYRNLEIILVDDGSTDESGRLCDEYAEADTRIKVIHQKNAGLSAARNSGIDVAQGEYIVFVDSDDWVHESYVSHLYELLQENDSDIAICSYYYVDRDYAVLPPLATESVETISGDEAVYRCTDVRISEKYNVAWNKIYHRSLFKTIRYPVGKINEDEFTSYKLYKLANKVTITDKCLYYYYQRSDSIMNKPFSYKNLAKLEAYEERIELLQQWNMVPARINMLFSYHWNLRRFIQLAQQYGTIDDAIIMELQRKAESMKQSILSCEECTEDRKRQALYQYMTDEEIARLAWEAPVAPKDKYHFVFPFSQIPNGSRVIIYGAGVMGRQFFEQLIGDANHYNKLVAWVDANWKKVSDATYVVEPLDRILTEDYDYIVVAVSNHATAHKIADNLVGWGIGEDRIIFGDSNR